MSDADRALFIATAKEADIVWVVGTELGQTAHAETDVLLWPYNHKDARELAETYVHEIVHQMYPDLGEGAINAKTASLFKLEWCRREAYRIVAQELLEAVKEIKLRTKGRTVVR